MVGDAELLFALILSSIFEENIVYLVFMLILLLSLFMILLLFRLSIRELKDKISSEI